MFGHLVFRTNKKARPERAKSSFFEGRRLCVYRICAQNMCPAMNPKAKQRGTPKIPVQVSKTLEIVLRLLLSSQMSIPVQTTQVIRTRYLTSSIKAALLLEEHSSHTEETSSNRQTEATCP